MVKIVNQHKDNCHSHVKAKICEEKNPTYLHNSVTHPQEKLLCILSFCVFVFHIFPLISLNPYSFFGTFRNDVCLTRGALFYA